MLRTLKDFGFGKKSMDGLISGEVSRLIAHFKLGQNKNIQVNDLFNIPIINALWKITASESFDYEDPKLKQIMFHLFRLFKTVNSPGYVCGFAHPWLLNFDFVRKLLGWNEDLYHQDAVRDMLEKTIESHRENLDENDPKDFIDMMLIEMKTEDQSSSFYGSKGEESLLENLFDLFAAGSDTTSTTLTWSVLYMLLFPEVQEEVQHEIDRVVGRDRLPKISDRAEMPFT